MRHLLVAAIATAMNLCDGAQASTWQPSSPQEQAEFLAGIQLGKRSILSSLQKSPEYRQHQKELQEQWTFCRKIRYGIMQQWAREHLARYPATRGVLRYLFGGPDFLNACAFFPDTRIMVLGGLEPVGEVPPPEALDPASLGTALKALEESLRTSLFCGYFITSEMKPQLSKGSFRGVLPVLYTELALTGNIIDSVSMIRPFGSPGVEIIYHRPGGTSQILFYFQADLSNGKECRRFLAWLGDLGTGATYLKAASYLLPLDSFSETRNFLTRTSSLILQDDSGLPFRSFLPGEWQIELFGVYTDPLPVFRLGRDPRLDEAYHSGMRSGPLAFGAGYHVQPDDANLLLAVRLQSAALVSTEIPQMPPPALPSFASPAPKSKPIRIRKALPVPIKKAVAVPPPRPTPSPSPLAKPTPEPTPEPSPEKTPEATLNQALENPATNTDNREATNGASRSQEVVDPLLAPQPFPVTAPVPKSTATPAPTVSSTPEAQSTPSPFSSTSNEDKATEPTPASTPAPSPETKLSETPPATVASPVSTPSATPQQSSAAEMPQEPQPPIHTSTESTTPASVESGSTN